MTEANHNQGVERENRDTARPAPPGGAVTIRPLVIPTSPSPDESLVGLVARAAEANVLGSTYTILQELGLAHNRPARLGLELNQSGPALAHKLGCSSAEIERIAHPYEARIGRSAPVRWGGTALERTDLDLTQRRISPATLESQDHHASAWLLSLITHCPISFELLVDACTACGKALGWKGARGIGTCEHCRKTVRGTDGERLPDDLRAGYTTFANLISIVPAVREETVSKLDPKLQALSTNAIVDLVITLGRILVPGAADARRDRFSILPPLIAAQLVSTGASLLSDWPNALWLRLAQRHDMFDTDERAVIYSLQWRAYNRDDAPDTKLLREALPELFSKGRKTLRCLDEPLMSPSEFRGRTGLSEAGFRLGVKKKSNVAREIQRLAPLPRHPLGWSRRDLARLRPDLFSI